MSYCNCTRNPKLKNWHGTVKRSSHNYRKVPTFDNGRCAYCGFYAVKEVNVVNAGFVEDRHKDIDVMYRNHRLDQTVMKYVYEENKLNERRMTWEK